VKSRLSRLVPSVQRALREAQERTERKKAEEALRRNEMYLAEAQRLSRTGSFGWDPVNGEIYWSDETSRIFECEPTIRPTIQLVLDRTHPDDRMCLRQIIDRASIERSEFTAEHRLLMADGSVKYVRAVAHPSTGEDPESIVFVGAVQRSGALRTRCRPLRRASFEIRCSICWPSRRLTSVDNHVLTRADTMSPFGANATSIDVRCPALLKHKRPCRCIVALCNWCRRDGIVWLAPPSFSSKGILGAGSTKPAHPVWPAYPSPAESRVHRPPNTGVTDRR
jgi:hypothetical protein